MHLKDIIKTNPIFIAPMAGISNGAFRELCLEFGAGLVGCEMVSDKAIFYGNEKTRKMLEVESHPTSLQLFGSDIQTMVIAAKILDQETNCDVIDINMGCPVNKVIKTGAGSALMKDEDKATAIVSEIVKNVNKPVTVKMRLGFDHQNMNYLSLAKKLEKTGIEAITLHARTRSQMYDGKADWSHIKTLKENLTIPVIGNGDVKTVEDFIKMKEETGCDAVMIGRGIVGNPFLIKEIDNYLKGNPNYQVDPEDRFKELFNHTNKLINLKGEKSAIREMRGLAPHYISGLYMATVYKNKMSKMETLSDLETIINELKEVISNKPE